MVRAGDYDPTVTDLCERMLVTVIGNAGSCLSGCFSRPLHVVSGRGRDEAR